jgi:hypothetical protein
MPDNQVRIVIKKAGHRTRRRQAPGFFNHNPDLIVRHGQENQKALLINLLPSGAAGAEAHLVLQRQFL